MCVLPRYLHICTFWLSYIGIIHWNTRKKWLELTLLHPLPCCCPAAMVDLTYMLIIKYLQVTDGFGSNAIIGETSIPLKTHYIEYERAVKNVDLQLYYVFRLIDYFDSTTFQFCGTKIHPFKYTQEGISCIVTGQLIYYPLHCSIIYESKLLKPIILMNMSHVNFWNAYYLLGQMHFFVHSY